MKLELQKGSRARFLAVVLTCAIAAIICRLFYLQVIKFDYYTDLAAKEQVKKLVIPAQRGLLFGMDGDTPVPLAMNQQVYTLFADPTEVKNPEKVEQITREVAGGNVVIDKIADTIKQKKREKNQYLVLARQVTYRQAELIKAKKQVGIGFQKVSERVYPENGLAAQVLGFVDRDGDGQYGVEGKLNDRLKGKDGILKAVTDISDVPLSIGKNNIRKNPQNGENVVLTIDRNIQAKAEQSLAEGLKRSEAKEGSVIVMDPKTGHVLAMANLPSYNPAEYYKVTDAALFRNNTISNPYEPGSDLKTFTVATGIDKGAITPQSTFYNTDSIRVDDITIVNALKGFTGTISMQTALNNSLNTGMVTIAQRLGDGSHITRQARDTMYDYFHNRFRLGMKTGVELQGELAGTVIPPTEVQGNAVRYSNMSFGQGLDVTMLQVASAFSAIINGGIYHTPTVLAGTVNNDGSGFKKSQSSKQYNGVISPGASHATKEMIYEARQSFTKDDLPGYYVGGKTGTSQTIVNGKYVFNQTIGTYLGYGGGTIDSTKYVIMVEVSAPGKALAGNTDAMPIFTDISNWMLNYYQIQPGK